MKEVLTRQLTIALKDVSLHNITRCIVGYEPTWAIGSGNVPTIDEIIASRIIMRKALIDLYNDEYAKEVPILYGGSVSDQNTTDIITEAGMDGVVVGTASLDPSHLIRIAVNTRI